MKDYASVAKILTLAGIVALLSGCGPQTSLTLSHTGDIELVVKATSHEKASPVVKKIGERLANDCKTLKWWPPNRVSTQSVSDIIEGLIKLNTASLRHTTILKGKCS